MKGLFSIVVFCIPSWILFHAQNGYNYLEGFAQGTSYHISYFDSLNRDLYWEVEDILRSFDLSLSTYDSNSVISRINRNEPDVVLDEYFKNCFGEAKQVWKETNGCFDPTVYPLVNLYGFGPEGCYKIEDRIIDSVMQFVGYDLIDIVNDRIVKKDKRVCLDFNALAQGYSVDVVAKFFDSLNIRTYLIEIGGEVYAKGIQPNGDNWLVGIEVPEDNSNGENELHSVVILKNQALATSGNYRKFKIVDGVRYSHQLDPHTGLSTQNSLLSATVFTESCISSDAYATAFMVMGYDKTLLFLESHPEINVILIYVDENGNYKHYESEKIMNLIVPIDE
ncbi:MAG: FAD:protein FMN transferase [Flavobacteriales bacterium]|nr:FAD:protein FMN transferase [Flavobacteriales bacterium]